LGSSSFLLKQACKKELWGPHEKPSQEQSKRWKNECKDLLLSTAASQIGGQCAIILLEMLGTEASVGQASIILIIVSIQLVVLSPVTNHLSTMIRKEIHNVEKLQQIQIKKNRLQLLILSITIAIQLTFLEQVLGFFGDKSVALKDICTVIILITGIWSYTSFVTSYLLNTENGKINSMIQITRVFAEVVVLIFAIPYFGLWGALLVPAVITIISKLYTARRVYHLTNINALALW
jgi:O-antigen/teichoic acid export membrane protein